MTKSIAETMFEASGNIWELRDKRVDGWPLMNSPLKTILICLIYLFFVKILGPKWMEKRQAFELRRPLIVYNLFQIVLSGWMTYETCRVAWFNGYSLVCQPVDYSDNEESLRLLLIGYCFYLSKFADFLDTVFFILRKKSNQITFLHLYHHAIMPLSVWFVFRFIGGGHSTFAVTFNSFVHFIMYFYYLLAAMGPTVQQYLGWKKYLTKFQMAQFVFVTLHSSQLILFECDFPRAYFWSTITQAIPFFLLFKNFHSKTYSKKSKDN